MKKQTRLADLFEISTSSYGNNGVLQRLDDGTRYQYCGPSKDGIRWRCNKYCGSNVLTDKNMLYIIAAKLEHKCASDRAQKIKPTPNQHSVPKINQYYKKAPKRPIMESQPMQISNSQPPCNFVQDQSSQIQMSQQVPHQNSSDNTIDRYFQKASQQPIPSHIRIADATSNSIVKNDPEQPQDLDPLEESKSGGKKHTSTQVCFGDADEDNYKRALSYDENGNICFAGLSHETLKYIQKIVQKHQAQQSLAPIRHPSTPIVQRENLNPNTASIGSGFTLNLHPLGPASEQPKKFF